MKKMRLQLDALEVDSFQTSWQDSWEGTVLGAQDNVTGGGATHCGGVQTCGEGCGVSRGEVTQCGGVQTCGDCGVSRGEVTECGGVQTCGDGCGK